MSARMTAIRNCSGIDSSASFTSASGMPRAPRSRRCASASAALEPAEPAEDVEVLDVVEVDLVGPALLGPVLVDEGVREDLVEPRLQVRALVEARRTRGRRAGTSPARDPRRRSGCASCAARPRRAPTCTASPGLRTLPGRPWQQGTRRPEPSGPGPLAGIPPRIPRTIPRIDACGDSPEESPRAVSRWLPRRRRPWNSPPRPWSGRRSSSRRRSGR